MNASADPTDRSNQKTPSKGFPARFTLQAIEPFDIR